MAKKAPAERILHLAREQGVLRLRDATALGIHPEDVRRLATDGRLIRSGRGLYMLAEADVTEHHSLVEAARRVPEGIVCLLSALEFHQIGTQMPHQVWLAMTSRPAASRRPSAAEVVRFSGEALQTGIEVRRIEGMQVRVYGPAKTVADCFKDRNKIGLDIALGRCAKAGGPSAYDGRPVALCQDLPSRHVMRPYLEGLT